VQRAQNFLVCWGPSVKSEWSLGPLSNETCQTGPVKSDHPLGPLLTPPDHVQVHAHHGTPRRIMRRMRIADRIARRMPGKRGPYGRPYYRTRRASGYNVTVAYIYTSLIHAIGICGVLNTCKRRPNGSRIWYNVRRVRCVRRPVLNVERERKTSAARPRARAETGEPGSATRYNE
jgi:hypothetical protein